MRKRMPLNGNFGYSEGFTEALELMMERDDGWRREEECCPYDEDDVNIRDQHSTCHVYFYLPGID